MVLFILDGIIELFSFFGDSYVKKGNFVLRSAILTIHHILSLFRDSDHAPYALDLMAIVLTASEMPWSNSPPAHIDNESDENVSTLTPAKHKHIFI